MPPSPKTSTYHAWRGDPTTVRPKLIEGQATYADIPGFCKSADLELIKQHRYVLTPDRYVGAEEVEDDGEPFEEKMAHFMVELNGQFAESAKLEKQIKHNLATLGTSVGANAINLNADHLKRCIQTLRSSFIFFEQVSPDSIDQVAFRKDLLPLSATHGLMTLEEVERWFAYCDNRNAKQTINLCAALLRDGRFGVAEVHPDWESAANPGRHPEGSSDLIKYLCSNH